MTRVRLLFVHCLAAVLLIIGAGSGGCTSVEQASPPPTDMKIEGKIDTSSKRASDVSNDAAMDASSATAGEAAIDASSDTAEETAVDTSMPPLMESIRFPDEVKICGIRVPLEMPEVRQSLEKEMLLIVWDRPQVILWMMRAARYFPHIDKILIQEGLPLDLKYVPVIESGLRPHSGSSKGAVGYWQFIKSTGQKYGLRVDNQIDERRNIFKSTQAACLYLKKLYSEFESFLLALAAYNMGEYGLHGEIAFQENQDYFSLYLPQETQRYVFRIIAAKMILENPEKYGFFLTKSDLYPEFSFSKVNFNLNDEIPLVVIAKAAGVPFKTIKDMNPEIRGYTLAPGDNMVLIPPGKENGFKERFQDIYQGWEKNYRTKFHEVKPGETLSSIAQHYNMSLAFLLRLNNFSFDKVIHPGERVLIK